MALALTILKDCNFSEVFLVRAGGAGEDNNIESSRVSNILFLKLNFSNNISLIECKFYKKESVTKEIICQHR